MIKKPSHITLMLVMHCKDNHVLILEIILHDNLRICMYILVYLFTVCTVKNS